MICLVKARKTGGPGSLAMELKHDGQERLVVRHLDGIIEMAVHHPNFDSSDDIKGSVAFSSPGRWRPSH